MFRTLMIAISTALAAAALPAISAGADEKPEGVIFRESFEDSDLAKRGWYDGSSFRIAGGAWAGKGCIEYEWIDRQSKVQGSSPVRHLFEPTEEVLFKDELWHCVEAYFKLNTLDLENGRPNRDGVVRAWFDDKLVVERTDVVLRSTDFPKMKFNQFLMAPYFGPGLLPHAQKLWIDELAVGTRRIGPLP